MSYENDISKGQGFESFVYLKMKERKLKLKDVAEMLGYKPQSFRNKLSRQSLNLYDAIGIANILGCELAITQNIHGAQYVFTRSDMSARPEIDNADRSQQIIDATTANKDDPSERLADNAINGAIFYLPTARGGVEEFRIEGEDYQAASQFLIDNIGTFTTMEAARPVISEAMSKYRISSIIRDSLRKSSGKAT